MTVFYPSERTVLISSLPFLSLEGRRRMVRATFTDEEEEQHNIVLIFPEEEEEGECRRIWLALVDLGPHALGLRLQV
ncbi:hypothetical protein BGZ68_003746, partial [Mortierella alpina]